MKKKHVYLIHLQFLGFRFHGWSKQPGLKTVHGMVDKTLEFILQHDRFKTLGSSRTDARVSAASFGVALYLDEPINLSSFLDTLNQNFPTDIRALSIEEVSPDFNIIQSPKYKEYLYLFAFGEKAHPFSASLVTSLPESLDLEQMQKGAQLFEGTHNFQNYVTQPSAQTQLERQIDYSRIEKNTYFQADYFPADTYVYRIRSAGFMRNQVRLMMGQLLELGKGNIDLAHLESSLLEKNDKPFRSIAPASGLLLWKTEWVK